MRISVLAVVVFGYLTSVYSLPTPNRVKRASASASASSSSSSGPAGGSTFSATSSGTDFGPSGRIGSSGCPGFGCGIQFGDFFPAFGQLFTNNYNGGYSSEQQRAFPYSTNGFPAYNNYYDNNYYPQYSPDYQYYNPMYNNAQYNPPSFRSPHDVADFARMGPAGGAPYYPSGGSSSSYSSSSSSSHNGNGIGTTYTGSTVNGISSRTATVRDASGRVTTVQGGSGVPDTISTRMMGPGQTGVYSASGVQVNPDGNVSSYRTGGQY